MQMLTGTVVDGKIVLHAGSLPEGTEVALVVRESDKVIQLPPDLLAELNEAIDEADADEEEGISPEKLFEELKKYRTP